MSITITLTDEQAKQLAEGQAITIQPPKKVWEPKGGKWLIGLDDDIYFRPNVARMEMLTSAAALFETKELAEKARDAMRIHNRLLAYVLEHAPDWEPDWDNDDYDKYSILCANGRYEIYAHMRLNFIGAVYMPEQVAKELCEKLNNGEVVL